MEKLTLAKRLKLCFEILTYRSKHNHSSHTKGLSLFIQGYDAGVKDEKLNKNY